MASVRAIFVVISISLLHGLLFYGCIVCIVVVIGIFLRLVDYSFCSFSFLVVRVGSEICVTLAGDFETILVMGNSYEPPRILAVYDSKGISEL